MSRYQRYVKWRGPSGRREAGLTERALRALARLTTAHRKGILALTGLFVVVAAALGGNVSSRLSQGGFDAPSEQSVQAADVLASQFHNGADNLILLVTARRGTVDSPDVDNAGSVQFSPAPNGRGTEVKVALTYAPPAGRLGSAVATAFGASPDRQVREGLRRFKQRMEAHEVATSDIGSQS